MLSCVLYGDMTAFQLVQPHKAALASTCFVRRIKPSIAAKKERVALFCASVERFAPTLGPL